MAPGLTFAAANARMVPMMKKQKFRRRIAAWISGIMIGTACLTGCAHGGGSPLSQSSFLLDTFVTVTIYGSRHIFPQKNKDILQGTMDLCKRYEDLLSTTRDTSEIYKINHRQPGTKSMTVSEDTARVIERGLEYCRMSDGAFDITVEPLSSLWDFKSNDPQVPDLAEIEKDLHKVDSGRFGWKTIRYFLNGTTRASIWGPSPRDLSRTGSRNIWKKMELPAR